jgi:hypothetical protein
MVAISDPIVGMKFNKKIKKAQKMGESIPMISNAI